MKHQEKNPLLAKSLIKAISLIFIFSFATPKKVAAQSDGEVAAAAAVVGVAVFAAVWEYQKFLTWCELTATEEYLSDYETEAFTLSILKVEGAKKFDQSGGSVMAFTVVEKKKNAIKGISEDGVKYVYLWFCSSNWINSYGIDYNRVRTLRINEGDWNTMASTLYSLASPAQVDSIQNVPIITPVSDESYTPENGFAIERESGSPKHYNYSQKSVPMSHRRIALEGVYAPFRDNSQALYLPFYKIPKDSYIQASFTEDINLLYGKKGFSLYLKDTKDLMSIQFNLINDINRFFYD